MRFLQDRFVALLLAAVIAIAVPAAAQAASLAEALTKITTDEFSDTAGAIANVASSGAARAATIIEALQDGRLLFSADQKAVFYKDKSGKLIDGATGQAVAGDPSANLAAVRINNRIRRAIDAALGELT